MRRVFWTEIRIDGGVEASLVRRALGRLCERLHRLRAGEIDDLPGQGLLRSEVRIEAAVSQPGTGHDFIHADAFDAVDAEGSGGRLHDPLTCLLSVLLRPGHQSSQLQW